MNKHIRNIIIIFIVVIILELTIFNFRTFRVLDSKNSRTFTGKEISKMESEEYISLYYINNVKQEIKTIHIELINGDNVVYEISCNDETMTDVYALPNKVYLNNFESSKYIVPYLSRKN